jgi:hypothetical protein
MATNLYLDPARLVLRSLEIGTPFFTFNRNYRLNVFGCLGSTDILNTQDQAEFKGLNLGTYD